MASGALTELYSEVLAQICLAYSIKKGKALTKDVLCHGNSLNPTVLRDIKRLMIAQRSVNFLTQILPLVLLII